MRPHAKRLQVVYADGGYAGPFEQEVLDTYKFRLEIVSKPPEQKGFVVLPKRWIVERTFAWGGKYRRLRDDYEFQPDSSKTMFLMAMVHRMVRHLRPD
jgi:putative transposase